MIERLSVVTPGRGLHEITAQVEAVVGRAGVAEGLCTVFVRHTSARALALGQWQGIYLWEHRRRGSGRELVLHIGA